jgi:2-polyprenyl-3-methyl-5-hydroxy-6-metoxy-1,4-benzoquinol methylase
LVVTSTDLFDSRFGTPGTYTVAQCTSCGLEQLTPLPSQEHLKQLYENHYNFGGERDTTYTSLRQRFLFSPLYRIWMAIDGDISFHDISGTGRLLDVGCNEGRGLQFYRRSGWQAEGLELNENAAAVARKQGFTVNTALIEDFVPAHLYDVVILSNVLEHSLNPHEMLVHVKRLLKPGGQVWISCPNGTSWLRSIFGRFWINWHVPFHIVQFSASTLQNLLKECGFSTVTVQNETPALWVAHSIIARLTATPGKQTTLIRNPLLIMLLIGLLRGICFPALWLFNRVGKGDCLVVTAVKS